MTKVLILITSILLFISYSFSQGTSCATSIPLANGACLTNQSFPGSVNMAGTCVGGNNPTIYIRFTAGSCSTFEITPSANSSTIGSAIYTYPGCSYVSNSVECHDNVVSGNNFNAGAHNILGNYLLTPGQQYVLQLWGPVGSNTFNICYTANDVEEASNECGGAIGLGTSASTFYNGSDCAFTGSYTDGTTTDPPANQICAGSLENTQWIQFMPQAGVTSFQIIGTNISCTGGGCGFQFGIFSGSCGSLTSEGCYGNKVCSGGQPTVGPINTNPSDGFSISWSGTSSSGFTATITTSSGAPFIGTEVFYLVMDGNADADCTYTLQGINVQVLPIELISFTGNNSYDYNIINWSCATELNNDYFKLERSVDGLHWDVITIINGMGTTNIPTFYQYRDNLYIKNIINYYKLSQTDFNGNTTTYNLIAINNEEKESSKLIKTINYMGQEVDDTYHGFVIEIYENNTTRKAFRNP